MVAILGFSKEEIRAAVQDMYTVVAERPQSPLHFPVGRQACETVGYSADQLGALPPEAIESFAGVGCPFRAAVIKPGDTVLDVGSGSGTDVTLASKLVGDSGKVWALDMTPAMREKLGRTLEKYAITNVEILEGEADRIPLPDHSVDVVTSNGVLNLVPDKRKAVAEIFRVLKPGGHAQIADIVIANPVTPDCEDDPKLWAECVVGATVDENYLTLFRDAGFEEVEVLRDYDYFAHSPSADTRQVAKQFGAHAFELRMRRGPKAPSKIVQWAKRLSPSRVIGNIQRRGMWGMASLAMAVLACYGTLAVVALLSLLGVSVAVHGGMWAGAIIAFAATATIVIALGVRKHRSLKPAAIALLGTALLTYAMFVNYSLVVEVVGFLLLGVATYLDYDLRRWAPVPGGKQGAARAKRVRSAGEGASA